MKEAKFKIGDLVKTNHIGIGRVTDVMYSDARELYTYEVTNDEKVSELFFEFNLESALQKDYRMAIEIDIAQNVVIASMYEKDGAILRPVAKGHGHMIHEGELGIAQAASYACKRLYENLGGTLTKGGSWK